MRHRPLAAMSSPRNIKVPDLVPNIGGLGGIGSIAIIVGALSLVGPRPGPAVAGPRRPARADHRGGVAYRHAGAGV